MATTQDLTLNAITATTVVDATTFTIGFDFTDAGQKKNLQYLQENNYQLFAYKGASGPKQITAGLPTWFAEPFTEMFGVVEIDYTPKYKVYVFNQSVIGANTTIKMQVLSDEVGLGTALVFNSDGSITSTSGSVPADSIQIKNNRPASTSNVTVGLAALINGSYAPFCAFTSTPQGSINMTPHEKICMFAAQIGLQSGSVTAEAAAPGCTFSFSASTIGYDLLVIDGTYGLRNVDGTPYVTQISSGESLNQLLNL
ncbi:hypothetical protein [Pedobacter hartonius]|uniref:Uncharacterized protein n=1 Tax=Pedobacter hartonius TaxID=425514 RepID=A0A1H4B8I2_9SPHI|nr:hypothetical protein [Pedobacter hartonius]SEA44142.1 hypothetical protein SAMN05443550_103237 [Pedobacter hartonius]